jgi:AcrR family transcriptional regulator
MGNVKTARVRSSARNRAAGDGQNDRKTEILYAAAHLFIEKGFRASSLEDVAEQFGFKRQAIYYYFSSKEELLYEILSYTMDVYEETVARVRASTADPEEQLLQLVRAQVTDITTRERDGEFSILLDTEIHELTPDHRQEINRRRRESLHLHRDLLVALKRGGRLRDLDPTVAVLSLQSMVTGVARWYRRDGPLSAEEVAGELTRVAAGLLLRDDVGSG